MAESAVDWSFVGRVVGEKGPPGPVAFFVTPQTAITAGLFPTDMHLRVDMAGFPIIAPIEVRVVGISDLGMGVRLMAMEATRGQTSSSMPLGAVEAAPGQTWESIGFSGDLATTPKSGPADGPAVREFLRGDVAEAEGDRLRLRADAPIGRDSTIVGSPVVVAGQVAGVVWGSLGDRLLDAIPSGVVARALAEWIPEGTPDPEVRRFSKGADRALGLARAVENRLQDRVNSAEAVLLGLLLQARGSTVDNFAKNLHRYLQLRRSGDPIAAFARRKGFAVDELPNRRSSARPLTDADHGGIVGRAFRLRTSTKGDDWIAVRHLVGALIVDAPDVLTATGADLDRLRDEFLNDVARYSPDDDLDAWRRELAAGAASADGVRRVKLRAGYRPDDLGDQDELGITDDVNMLCDVLAARDAEPPVSVGLFGDWGTGKSFFMRQMERRINVLMRAAREAEKEGRTSAYCSNIVQIRFNAWSYMDASLWANLALGIFEQLASPPLEPGAPRDLEQERREQDRIAAERKRLLAELDTFRELQAEVELDQEVAESQKAEVQKQLDNIAQERAVNAAQLAKVRARDFIDELATDEDLSAVRTKAAQELGLADVPITELKSLAGDLKTLGGRARAVWRLLQERQATGKVAVAAVFCAAVLVLGLVLMWGPGRVRLAGVASFLGSVVAGLTAFVRLVRPVLAKTAVALDYLEQGVRRADERQRQLLQEQTTEEVMLTEKVRELEARQAALSRREAETAAKVAESSKALQELEQGRRLYRFIEERSATADYRQHLGIIALIRRDFERLTQLLRHDQPASKDLPRIDRIVLYVDDLDRCPPARVVEVLQAVHLLLAFPIFVVVVGVDARWLIRSLANHYSEMLGPRRGGDGQDDDPELAGWESTPQNYLEKIFQIPFALSPMGTTGFSQLVRSLVGASKSSDGAKGGDREPTDVKEPSLEVAADPVVPEGAADPLPEEGETEVAEPAQAQAPAQAPASPPPLSGIDANPPSLEITEQELDFIGRLGPAIATPRLAKRLVNVYRLVRASQSDQDLVRYLERHDYQAVLVLLAILVGFPAQAGLVYEALAGAPSGSWSDFVRDFQSRDVAPGKFANRFDSTLTEEEARQWDRLQNCLMELHKAVDVSDDVTRYSRWVVRLSRFSFETGRLRAQRQREAPSSA